MPSITHFEINADDVGRAVKFYQKVFDWDIRKDQDASEEYWLVRPKENEPQVTAGIMQRAYPEETTVVTYQVATVDGFRMRILDAGGRVYEEEPIVLPGIGYMHYCEDPDGNVFGILQYDEKAE